MALKTLLYKDHPYGHPDPGTEAGLKAITLDDVKSFHRQHYTLDSLDRGIAGGFKPETVMPQARPWLRCRPPALALLRFPTPRPPRGLEVTIVEKPADATAISIGFPINVTRRDADFYALAVANSYLGEHRTFNGKLMQDLRASAGSIMATIRTSRISSRKAAAHFPCRTTRGASSVFRSGSGRCPTTRRRSRCEPPSGSSIDWSLAG